MPQEGKFLAARLPHNATRVLGLEISGTVHFLQVLKPTWPDPTAAALEAIFRLDLIR